MSELFSVTQQDMPAMAAHIESLTDAGLALLLLSVGQSAFEDPGESVEDDPESPFYDSTTEQWFLVMDMIEQELERRAI